ncbi:MAG: TonB-dependent receptor plug domain-containing protein, partial [Bacteroidia bacterium]|nr:TonB-dependent receptor plug domain-containing protein [Bacteroidia bacterium]
MSELFALNTDKVMRCKISCLVFCLSILSLTVTAQTGTIKGVVSSSENGETLIGAAVVIKGTTTGMSTGLDGDFMIDVKPGSYNILCSFISFGEKTIEGVVVKEGETTELNIKLDPAGIEITGVSVEARALQNTENAVQNIQRESTTVMDAISAQQISRMGDGDAAAAVRRVSGVSIEGGKYLTVRGLGDRYSKTALNGIEVPSLDPDRNSVQMDMLPTNLLDNIQVVKSFTPDLPGSFSGGYVNLITKDFPDQASLHLSAGFGVNENATFNNNYITSRRSSTDLLGFDDGLRDVPLEAMTGVPDRYVDNDRLDQVTRSFNKDMTLQNRTPGPNMSYSFSIGDQIPFLGKSLGVLASINYSKSNSFYQNGFVGRYNVPSASTSEQLNPRFLLQDSKASEEVLWGAMTSFNYRLAKDHSIGINLIRNQSG